MKKGLLLLILCSFFLSSCIQSQSENKTLDEIIGDLAYSNHQLWGALEGNPIYFEEFGLNCTKISYNRYLDLIKTEESNEVSTKGISNFLRNVDVHIFAVNEESFFIVVYSSKYHVILIDDPITTNLDTVKVLKENDLVPDLRKFVDESKYKIVSE